MQSLQLHKYSVGILDPLPLFVAKFPGITDLAIILSDIADLKGFVTSRARSAEQSSFLNNGQT